MRSKKIMYKLLFFLAMMVLLSMVPIGAQTLGDANRDNAVNIVDALMVAQYYVGLNPTPFYTAQADVNCDGSITIVDALTIAQYYVGLISGFPCSGTPTRTSTGTPTITRTSTATASGTSATTTPGTSGSPVACSGAVVWNSQIVYNTTGQLVAYNCKLYRNEGFAYNLNPETNNGQYMQWTLLGPCTESNCAMGEGPFIGCGQYDKYVLGTWTVYNNVWGGAATSQCLTATSISNWSVVSTQPATSGVKSYPNTGIVNVNKSIGSIGTFTSSFNVSVPSTGDWEVAYDIWVPTEIMLWMYTVGNVGPIASAWNDDGTPVAEATNVTVGGHTWNVYHGGSNVVSMIRTTNTLSGTVDIKAVLAWIVSQGWISNSGIVGASQFGFEISGTNNTPLTYKCNSFSMTVN